MIILRMSNNDQITLPDTEVDEWINIVDDARYKNVFINVHDPDDKEHKNGINPDHIVSWEFRS